MNLMKKGFFAVLTSQEYSQYIEKKKISTLSNNDNDDPYSDIRYCKVIVNETPYPFLLPSTLRALSQSEADSYNLKSGRHPASSYRISINRLTDKMSVLCRRIESLLLDVKDLEHLQRKSDQVNQVLDYLELTLYSFCEHYEDIKDIIENTTQKNSRAAKSVKKKIGASADRIKTITNHIKHSQKRLRLSFLQYLYDGELGLHIGFHVEKCTKDTIEPDPLFHKNSSILSINALMWEAVTSVFYMNYLVADFIRKQKNIEDNLEERGQEFSEITKIIQSLLRLPTMSFNEQHPRIDNKYKLIFDEKFQIDEIKSELVGSAMRPWKDYKQNLTLGLAYQFEADGIAPKGKFNTNIAVRLHNSEL